MKIIAISDTHIKTGSLKEQLPADLLTLLKDADMILHAGDFVTKRAFDEFSALGKIEAVHGNMDDAALHKFLPERRVIEVEGLKIGIVHEASLSLQDMTGAWYLAKEMSVDVLIFGHIHRPLIEMEDSVIACPGSPTLPRLSEPSAIEFNIEDGGITGRIITFKGTKCGALESARSFHR